MTESSKHSDSPSNLVQLLCAMQKSLLTWCGGQLQNGGPEGKSASTALISECKFQNIVLYCAVLSCGVLCCVWVVLYCVGLGCVALRCVVFLLCCVVS